ncbi:hypothetical protein QFC22_002341 [Naganishia vaughanmartiniae]|uniref:Uncharacterized protein n=1 Tax=Naganishia vaughanmartiniae TaxID=1424756 RepID=A0ACC2XCE5_9TREE|nr:hypothetical protein QFC22_002341 [Naganishia vaughanmartiniae]
MDEFGAPPVEEDFTTIPLEDRCTHKNWKARQSAYIELITRFGKTASDDDPFFRPYLNGDILKKWVTDSNAVAQEKGVDAVCALLKDSGENAARTRPDVVPSLVDKCLGSTRAGTKRSAIELCMLYIEAENTGEGVINDLLRGLDAKQPKLVASTVTALKQIVTEFGVKPLGDIKPIAKALSKIFAHSDKTVRAEGTGLTLALYSYLGQALLPSLQDLKPVQLKELTEAFQAMDASGQPGGSGKPTRFTRKQAREMEAAASSGAQPGDMEEVEPEAEQLNALDLVEAADIVRQLPSNFHEQIASTKWKDKVELLTDCLKVLEGKPKIVDNPELSSYVSALAAKMKDVNVLVVQNSAAMIAALATGVENKGFGKYRSVVMPPILDRLKEKKTMDALGNTLDAVFSSTTFSEIVEDCVTALKNKNPMVRQGTLLFLVRALASTRDQPTKNDLEAIAKAQVSQLGDSQGDVRAAAMEGLGHLMKIFGERAMNPYLEGVSEIQQGKIKEAFEKAEVKCKGGAAKPTKSASTKPAALQPSSHAINRGMPNHEPTSKPLPRKPVLSSMRATAEPPGSPAIRSAQKVATTPQIKTASKSAFDSGALFEDAPRPVARPPPIMKRAAPPSKPAISAKPATKPAGASALPAPGAGEPVKYKFTPEDAEAQAAELIPTDIQSGLADGQWKERLGAAERLVTWIEKGDADNAESEVIFRYLCKTPGWNEKNFQVSGKVFGAMAAVAQRCSTFGRSSAALAIGPLSDKLGDLKLKKPASETLGMFAEKTSLGFVLSQAYEPMTKQKAPKAQADALTWVKQSIIEFGIAGVALKYLIAFLKTGLQSANGAVRSSATATLVTLRLYIGTDVTGFLEDLNPALLSTINSEFDKVANQTAPEPTRQSEELQRAVSSGAAATGAGRQGATDPLEDLIPRVDLDKLVATTSVIADSKSDSWKVRKEAFEALLAVLEQKSNSRLKSSMGEIGTVLKNRLSDANLSVKILCLNIVSKIAVGMGLAFQAHARSLSSPVASVLADQKVTTRNAALETLGIIAEVAEGLDCMIAGFATSLENNNPLLRSSLLGFVVAQLQKEGVSPPADLSPLIPVTLSSIEDRSADVRKPAQALLPLLVAIVGFAEVSDKVANLKPASRNTIMPLLDKARSASLSAKSAKSAPEGNGLPQTQSTSLMKAPARTAAKASSGLIAGALPTAAPGSPRVRAPLAPPPARATGMAMKANALRASSLQQSSDDNLIALPRPAARSRLSIRPSTGIISEPTARSSVERKEASSNKETPFSTVNMEPKAIRAKRDLAKWSFDTNNPNQLLDYLQKQMEGHVNADLVANLFSNDRLAEKDHMSGLTTLDEFYTASSDGNVYGIADDILEEIRHANMDLALKYTTIRMQEGSTQMILKCLDIILHIVENVNQSEHRSFSDAEINVFMPVLIRKLGDNKFKDKLSNIFAIIDRTVPSSKVLQFCVENGVDSTNSKTRAASLEMLSHLIRKRGDIAPSASSAKLYRRIAEQISSPDSNTRNHALDCIAYLHKYTGKSAFSYTQDLSQKERDLLQNRIEKLAGSRSSGPSSVSSPPRELESSTATSDSSDLLRHGSTASTGVANEALPEPTLSREDKNLPAASSSETTQDSSEGPPAYSRPRTTFEIRARAFEGQVSGKRTAIPHPSAPDIHPSASPVLRSSPTRHSSARTRQPAPPAYEQTRAEDLVCETAEDVEKRIREANTSDAKACVDRLKALQAQLIAKPHLFVNHVPLLLSTVTRQFGRLFEKEGSIDQDGMFRMAKHLIQTMSNFCDLPELLAKVTADILQSLLEQLTLGLLLLTQDTHKEMARFVNMTILRLFAASDQVVLFRSLFSLLNKIAAPFTPATITEGMAARHGELVLKCIWKRSRSAEADIRKGKLRAVDLFLILEEFLAVVPAREWKRRSTNGVPLGDMPLRTIKVLIQHIFGVLGERGSIEALQLQFGDDYKSCEIYTYVWRLCREGRSGDREHALPVEREDGIPSEPAPPYERGAKPTAEVVTEAPAPSLIEDELDQRLQQLVTSASGVGSARGEAMPELHTFLKQHPEKKPKFEAMLDVALGASKYKLFIKRKLQNLAEAGTAPAPSNGNSGAAKPAAEAPSSDSPQPSSDRPSGPRHSIAPSSIIPADADDDTKLAMYREKLKYYALGNTNGTPEDGPASS